MISPTQVKLFVVAAILGLTFWSGWTVKTWKVAKDQLVAERASRVIERGLQKSANQAEVRYADRLLSQEETAQKNAALWTKALQLSQQRLADCRVDAELVGLLNDATVPAPAGPAAQPGPRAEAAVQAQESNCAAELGTCRRNYVEVCVPNAVQLQELQSFYKKLQQDYNRAANSGQ